MIGLPESNRKWKSEWLVVEAPWMDFDVTWNQHPKTQRSSLRPGEYSVEDEQWARDLIRRCEIDYPKVKSLITHESIEKYNLRGEGLLFLRSLVLFSLVGIDLHPFLPQVT